jgi:hypothetical protein
MKTRKWKAGVLAALLVLTGLVSTASASGGLQVDVGICAGDKTVVVEGGAVYVPGITVPLPGQHVEVEEFTLIRIGGHSVTVPGVKVDTPDQLATPAIGVSWDEQTFYIPAVCLDHSEHIDFCAETEEVSATVPDGSVGTPGIKYHGDSYTIDLGLVKVTVPGPSVEVPPGEVSWQEQTVTLPAQKLCVPDETIEIKVDLSGL